jgi:hypothetical protein
MEGEGKEEAAAAAELGRDPRTRSGGRRSVMEAGASNARVSVRGGAESGGGSRQRRDGGGGERLEVEEEGGGKEKIRLLQ